ncbi:hypothetical protein AKJ62_00305 [candidate division MSBL1 archaeon SCGC-AAA259D14]|uniref:BFN domain-containing protein n=2 Tax=candidate division MSBL1 TaxID=215777 RepID=A0A133U8Y2_9EURY|nr:hypothetical protein AKJ62_00305 [candidate division MSBL1 archaeon SCGC-AAA259D14]KXA93841.1 hypothetical protein AKJ66_00705 [candidate division MSBL1 archaeon SCGC-AAA259E22]
MKIKMVLDLDSVKAIVEGVYRTQRGFVVILETKTKENVLPVFVSKGQAFSIESGVTGEGAPRPLTHDLILKILEDMDLEIESVTIDDLIDGTFLAELRLVRGDRFFPYDVRPSDGVALAVRCNATIYISEDVMERAGREKEELLGSRFEK